MKNKELIIYTDGGARGNPGPAGIGGLVGEEEFSEYIGETTNNVAEYKAVVKALEIAQKQLGSESKNTRLHLFMDSELVKKQLTGEYRVKNTNLRPLHRLILDILNRFAGYEITHVLRTQNKAADRLVNKALDKSDH